ncbi:MAG: sporulation protein YunB [Clostridia bacterium]|nr:sporulation protein YunB [Clostridia bacterium]
MRLGIRRSNGKKIFILFAFVFFISVLLGFILRRLEMPFTDAVAAYAAAVGNDAVNNAVENCLSDNEISYEDLVILKENDNGMVTSMAADGLKISRLKSLLTASIQESISNTPSKKVSIPIGSAQSSKLLSAFGPKLRIKISPASITKIDFRDVFSDAGINQVRHTIYLDVSISVTVTSSSERKTYDVPNSILIADTVIVGNVPDYYGGLAGRQIIPDTKKSD